MQNAAGPGVLVDCPTRLAVEILADKWSVLVIYALGRAPRRHGELVGILGGVSRKVLTDTLRRLQRYGLVERRAGGSRSIDYRLTELGRTLLDPIETLTDWATTYGPAVTEYREGT